MGLFTQAKAAGFGAIGALLVGLVKGMGWRDIAAAIYLAGKTTAPIMFLLITAQMYSRLLALGGAVNFIQGMLIDSVSIVLLTVPIFVPIAMTIGVDPLA